ncbi:MAG: hypothetical protein K2L06_05025 [Alistipes sp.]|nr:hypothetical protein [Alistipes sp.]
MLNRIIAQYLESHRRLVIPQMGAFIVKEPGSSVLFSELLKRDDGVLLSLLTSEGVGEAAAAGEIDRFVLEVRRAVQQGREFPLEGLGVLKAGPNATISFVYAPQTGREGAASGVTSGTAAPATATSAPLASASAARPAARAAQAPEPAVGQRPAAAARPSAPEAETQPRKTGATVRDLYGADTRSAEHAQGAHSGQPAQTAPSRPSAPAQPGSDSLQPSQPSRFQLASKKLKRDELFADSYYGRLPRRPAIEQTVNVKRRSDHFIWIALIAAGIALAAILFGQWCDSFNREGEEVYLEQPADLLPDEIPQY